MPYLEKPGVPFQLLSTDNTHACFAPEVLFTENNYICLCVLPLVKSLC